LGSPARIENESSSTTTIARAFDGRNRCGVAAARANRASTSSSRKNSHGVWSRSRRVPPWRGRAASNQSIRLDTG
jgi:hypothetical protein